MISSDLCLDCDGCRSVCSIEINGAAPAGTPWDRSACVACGSCVEECPANARELAGTAYGVGALVDLVERDRPFFDASSGGVTFSGGEPMSQPAFLEAALVECRVRELHTTVDTCGYAPRDTVKKIGMAADLVLYDLKHMDSKIHRRFTGVDNGMILDNLHNLSTAGVEVWIRVPLIVGFNDDLVNLERTAAFVAGLPRRHRVDLLPYHRVAEGKSIRLERPESFQPFQTPETEALEAARSVFVNYGLDVRIGGSP